MSLRSHYNSWYIRKPELGSLWIIIYDCELFYLEYLKIWKHEREWECVIIYMHGEIFMLKMELPSGYGRETQCENGWLFCTNAAKQFMNLFIQPIWVLYINHPYPFLIKNVFSSFIWMMPYLHFKINLLCISLMPDRKCTLKYPTYYCRK